MLLAAIIKEMLSKGRGQIVLLGIVYMRAHAEGVDKFVHGDIASYFIFIILFDTN